MKPSSEVIPPDSGFDRIAWMYDFLAFLVFGQALKNAQKALLPKIPRNSRILIIGGGSGWLLQEVLLHCLPRYVLYVEASVQMLQRSRNRVQSLAAAANVEFRLGNETVIQPSDELDVVICPFFLDLFPTERLRNSILPRLTQSLSVGGIFLVTDFIPSAAPHHRLLIRTMYWFFGQIARIEASQLPPYDLLLNKLPLRKTFVQSFQGGLIESSNWVKTD
jgi:tRNA (cmo5U34)-methyltransferase